MNDYIKKIRTTQGDKQIDYEALANLPPSLPEVTSENEGQILMVVDGVWAVADNKGGGSILRNVNEVSF